MKILSHSQSDIVELEDGSRWRIFPGDIDITLGWTPEADLTPIKVGDQISSHVLESRSGSVRAIAADQNWSEWHVKSILKDG
jgi:hypothetical protein